VEEHQVHPKPFVPDPQPLLSANKCKLVAEFEQECFEMPDERVFQFAFRVFILQVEKFEHQRIANFLVSGHGIIRLGFPTFHQHRGFVSGQRRAFVELRVDLPVKLPDRPTARQRFARVKFTREGIPNAEQSNVMSPWERESAGNVAQTFNGPRKFLRGTPIEFVNR
jgi:hypothetical protein